MAEDWKTNHIMMTSHVIREQEKHSIVRMSIVDTYTVISQIFGVLLFSVLSVRLFHT